jgi:hypothetical protein
MKGNIRLPPTTSSITALIERSMTVDNKGKLKSNIFLKSIKSFILSKKHAFFITFGKRMSLTSPETKYTIVGTLNNNNNDILKKSI